MKEIVRIWAFAVKELRTILRQKRLLGTLVLGPFLVLLVFGLGFKGAQFPIRTLVVLPNDPGLSTDTGELERQFGGGSFKIAGVTHDEDEARIALYRGEVDAVVVVPGDAFEQVYSGRQAELRVLVNHIDPVRRAWTDYNTFVAVTGINRGILVDTLREGKSPSARLGEVAEQLHREAGELRGDITARNASSAAARAERMRTTAAGVRAVADESLHTLSTAGESLGAQAAAQVVDRFRTRLDRIEALLTAIQDGLARGEIDSLDDEAAALEEETAGLREEAGRIAAIPAEVLVSPLSAHTQNLAPAEPTYLHFYGPAVIALLLQHLAVTLIALSIVRERLLGTMELFRVSPVATTTIVVGKSLSFGLVALAIAGILVVLVNRVLGVPFFGDVRWLWASLIVLVYSSLGLGFLIGAVSRTENQAVQLAMLSLIAATFFGGFFIQLETLRPFALAVSYALPVTYGIRSLHDVMLRGVAPAQIFVLAPLAIGAVTYLIGTLVFRRQLRLS